jgi:hypothetical protein
MHSPGFGLERIEGALSETLKVIAAEAAAAVDDGNNAKCGDGIVKTGFAGSIEAVGGFAAPISNSLSDFEDDFNGKGTVDVLLQSCFIPMALISTFSENELNGEGTSADLLSSSFILSELNAKGTVAAVGGNTILDAGFIENGFVGAIVAIGGYAAPISNSLPLRTDFEDDFNSDGAVDVSLQSSFIPMALISIFSENKLNGEGPSADLLTSSFIPSELKAKGTVAAVGGNTILDAGFIENGFVGAIVAIGGYAAPISNSLPLRTDFEDDFNGKGTVDVLLQSFFIPMALISTFSENELNGEGPSADLLSSSFIPREQNAKGTVAAVGGNTIWDAGFIDNGFVGSTVAIGGFAAPISNTLSLTDFEDDFNSDGAVDVLLQSSFIPMALISTFSKDELNDEGPSADLLTSSFIPSELNAKGTVIAVGWNAIWDAGFIKNGFVKATVAIGGYAAPISNTLPLRTDFEDDFNGDGVVAVLLQSSFTPLVLISTFTEDELNSEGPIADLSIWGNAAPPEIFTDLLTSSFFANELDEGPVVVGRDTKVGGSSNVAVTVRVPKKIRRSFCAIDSVTGISLAVVDGRLAFLSLNSPITVASAGFPNKNLGCFSTVVEGKDFDSVAVECTMDNDSNDVIQSAGNGWTDLLDTGFNKISDPARFPGTIWASSLDVFMGTYEFFIGSESPSTLFAGGNADRPSPNTKILVDSEAIVPRRERCWPDLEYRGDRLAESSVAQSGATIWKKYERTY